MEEEKYKDWKIDTEIDEYKRVVVLVKVVVVVVETTMYLATTAKQKKKTIEQKRWITFSQRIKQTNDWKNIFKGENWNARQFATEFGIFNKDQEYLFPFILFRIKRETKSKTKQNLKH